MFFNAELPNAFSEETLQKEFLGEGISLSIEKILGYIVLAVNKYGTDWTIYVLKTKEHGEAIVYVSDEDELIVSTDYRELFSHYLNQENAEVYQERLRKFLVHYEIIQD